MGYLFIIDGSGNVAKNWSTTNYFLYRLQLYVMLV